MVLGVGSMAMSRLAALESHACSWLFGHRCDTPHVLDDIGTESDPLIETKLFLLQIEPSYLRSQ